MYKVSIVSVLKSSRMHLFLVLGLCCGVVFSTVIWDPKKSAENVARKDMQYLDKSLPKAMQGDTLKEDSLCSDVYLECIFSSNSYPELFWSKSGDLLSNNSHYGIQDYSLGNNFFLVMLHIKNTQEFHFGSYNCHCRNQMGMAKSTVTLREVSPPACVPATLAPVGSAASKFSIIFCIMFFPLMHVWLNLSGN